MGKPLNLRQQNILDHHAAFRRSMQSPDVLWKSIEGAALRDPTLGRLEEVRDFASNTRRGQQIRDAAGLALGEELMKISAFNTRYVEQALKCTEQIAPVPDQPMIGQEQYAWAFLNAAGEASWGADLTGGFPQAIVERDGRNYTQMLNAKAGYAYDDLDLARAALIPGFSLPTEKSSRCARMVAEAIDKAMYTGEAGGITLPALLNQTSIVQANVNNTGGALSTLTGDQLYSFYEGQFNAYLSAFGDAPKPQFHCLVDLSEHQRVNQTFVGTGKQYTVAELLQRAFAAYGFQGFDYNNRCATAGTGTSKMLCIYPRDGLKVGRVMAASYLQSAPDREGFKVSVQAYGRVGGLAFREPQTVRYVYNL